VGYFRRRLGIAIDQDEIFITDYDNQKILVFSKEGQELCQWRSGYQFSLFGITVSNDLVYVLDNSSECVQAFTRSGDYVFDVNISTSLLHHVLVVDDNAYVTTQNGVCVLTLA